MGEEGRSAIDFFQLHFEQSRAVGLKPVVATNDHVRAPAPLGGRLRSIEGFAAFSADVGA